MMRLQSGLIIIWSGAIVDIPAGWVICDGNNQTPDLRDRFVLGAGDTFDPDDTGGNINHNHTFTGDGHTHELTIADDLTAGTDLGKVSQSTAVTGTTDNADGRPPYYALAYVMKT